MCVCKCVILYCTFAARSAKLHMCINKGTYKTKQQKKRWKTQRLLEYRYFLRIFFCDGRHEISVVELWCFGLLGHDEMQHGMKRVILWYGQ